MCIIVVKPAGRAVQRETLERCFDGNPDGAGYMYPDGGEVAVRKGFFHFKTFWNDWRKTRRRLGDDITVVFHFRIATAGRLDRNNCHPHRVAPDLAFVHNGILFSVDGKSRVSDTIIYRDRYLRNFTGRELENPALFRLISDHIGSGNKFVFLNAEGKHVICNESSGVWDEGLWYSNQGYKPRPAVNEFLFPGGWRSWANCGAWQDQDEDAWPPRDKQLEEYCMECGQPLLGPGELALGVCEMCGHNVYGEEWDQYRRAAGI